MIGGVAKNIHPDQIKYHVPRLIKMGEQFDGYHIVIYENDSYEATRKTYIQELGKTNHSTYLYEDNIAKGHRTDNLAYARNKVLHYVQENLSHSYDYMMITDMDQTCFPFGQNDNFNTTRNEYDVDIFKYALSRSSEWDMVTFRHLPYWDLWAFRDKDHMPYNCWGPNKEDNPVTSSKQLDDWLNSLPPLEFVEIDSGFMLWAIYKISMTFGASYSGKGVSGEMDCEHVAFHRQMKERNGARIRLLPLVYCAGDLGYKPLNKSDLMRPS